MSEEERSAVCLCSQSARSAGPDAEDPWLGQYSMIIRLRDIVCKSCMEMSPLSRSPCFDPFASPLVLSIFVFLSCHSVFGLLEFCLFCEFPRRGAPYSSSPVAMVWIAFLRESPFFSHFSERDVVLLLISVERGVFVSVLHQICRSFLISVLRITRNFSCPQLVFVRSHSTLISTDNILTVFGIFIIRICCLVKVFKSEIFSFRILLVEIF